MWRTIKWNSNSKYYSGKEPIFTEGDVFRILVPLNDAYSFDFGLTRNETDATKNETDETNCETSRETKILMFLNEDPTLTQKALSEKTGISLGTIKRILPVLREKKLLIRKGSNRSGEWIVLKKNG